MKRVWLTEPEEVLGGIGTSWMQRYGISRDSRTGAWTIHDYRDARMNHEGSGTMFWHFTDTEALLDEDGDLGQSGLDVAQLLALVEGHAEPDLQGLAAEIRARR
jgi:hypothetical protein